MGFLSAEFDVKSPVNKFFQGYCDISGLPIDNVVKKELEHKPPEKSKVQYRIEGFQISKWYESDKTLTDIIFESETTKWQDPDWYTMLKGTMTVIDTEYNNGGRAGRAIWTVNFEKIPDDDIPDPRFITDTSAQYFQEMDKSIVANLYNYLKS